MTKKERKELTELYYSVKNYLRFPYGKPASVDIVVFSWCCKLRDMLGIEEGHVNES